MHTISQGHLHNYYQQLSLPTILYFSHLALGAQSFIQMPNYDSWWFFEGRQHIPENCKYSGFQAWERAEWVTWMFIWCLYNVPVYVLIEKVNSWDSQRLQLKSNKIWLSTVSQNYTQSKNKLDLCKNYFAIFFINRHYPKLPFNFPNYGFNLLLILIWLLDGVQLW